MRFWGLIGLVLVLVIVGLLAKKQLGAARAAAPGVAASASPDASSSSATVRDQSQRIQQQYRQALDAASLQQQRRVEDDAQ